MRRPASPDSVVHWRTALRDPIYFARVVLGVSPHPGQSAWLGGASKPENLLATGNRWGKSFVQAIRILHRAVFKIRSRRNDTTTQFTIVTASITQDQANIIFHTLVRLLHRSKILTSLVTSLTYTPYPQLTFSNDSVITARSTQQHGRYLLGHDYDLFVFDEAAYESDPDFLINNVVMMRLADRDGVLDLISTPNGKNWFYRRMLELSGDPSRGYVQNGDSRDNPYVSARALDARIRNLPADRVAQNIGGQFVDNEQTIFSNADIDSALKEYGPAAAAADHIYATGWDLARKRTHTVGMTFDITAKPYRMVNLTRFNNRDWLDVLQTIRRVAMAYPGKLVVDATGLGDVVMSELADLNPEGVVFTPRVKGDLLANLVLLHNRGEIKYYDVVQRQPGRATWSLEAELREVTWEDNQASDAVMAMGLALWPKRSRLLFSLKDTPPARVTAL
jgi:hypothetical protein